MIQQLEPATTAPVVIDDIVFDADELKALAKFLDALMEANFALKKSSEVSRHD